MFKSKTIGWLTACTLLAVAGVALACRLKDGSGQPVAAASASWADVAGETPPPPETPDVPEAPEVPVTPEIPAAASVPEPEAVPTPAPAAEVPPDQVAGPESFPIVPPPPPAGPPEPLPVAEPESVPVPAVSAPVVAPVPSEPTAPTTSVPQPIEIGAVPEPPVRRAAGQEPQAGEVVPAFTPPATPASPAAPSPVTVTPTPYQEPNVEQAREYRAGQGESLRDIARKVLGEEERWHEIEKLNPELRSRMLVPAGTVVRLPAEAGVRTIGGQVESEYVPAVRPVAGLKPLPVLRRPRPEGKKPESVMLGTFECKLQGKTSLVLPREVCEQLGKCETLLLTPGPDQCLWLVTEAGAARMLQGVEKAAADGDEVQAFRRLFFSQSRKVVRDAEGKTSLPEELADYAGLIDEVVLIGGEDHFEVWDSARWHQYSRQKTSAPKTPRTSDE